MHHFFIEPSQIEDGVIHVEGADVNHIKNVLRMKQGEQAVFSDGTLMQYLGALESSEPMRFRILDLFKEGRELPSRISLFQGIPKGDKMELVIQKATELGVSDIFPVSTCRTVVRLDAKKAEKKTVRWNEIAKASAKQCGRSRIPLVHQVTSFDEALLRAGEMDVLLIPYERAEGMEDTRRAVERILPGQSVGIFIGPEGGFEESEVELAVSKGASPITLGKRILRTETAGLVILSILLYHLE